MKRNALQQQCACAATAARTCITRRLLFPPCFPQHVFGPNSGHSGVSISRQRDSSDSHIGALLQLLTNNPAD
jgi:hypothetical protein